MDIVEQAKQLLLHDEVITYHNNGKIKSRCMYDADGKPNGIMQAWNLDGSILFQFEYKHGELVKQ